MESLPIWLSSDPRLPPQRLEGQAGVTWLQAPTLQSRGWSPCGTSCPIHRPTRTFLLVQTSVWHKGHTINYRYSCHRRFQGTGIKGQLNSLLYNVNSFLLITLWDTSNCLPGQSTVKYIVQSPHWWVDRESDCRACGFKRYILPPCFLALV